GSQGLFVFKYLETSNTFTLLGSYNGYQGPTANHSGYLTADCKHFVFTDEISTAPIKLVNVENPANIQPESNFLPHTETTAHNPYVVGNNWAVVASYMDGINIYNIADRRHPWLCGHFDTYPQAGFNVADYNNEYCKGNWGAYPFLPSGKIIATDMQNGIFILDPSRAYSNKD